MKSWKWMGCACLLSVAFLLNGCGGKYADVKKANGQFVKIMEGYVQDLEKAEDAKDVAGAMNSYADRLEKIWPGMMKLQEKYPELKDQDQVPDDLKDSMEDAKDVGMKMAGTFMKIAPYMSDEDVMKAQERIAGIMMQK